MSRRRVLVLRAIEDADGLCDALAARGAEAVRLPLLAYAPGPDIGGVASAVAALDNDGWVVLTSPRAVAALAATSAAAGRVAVVGPRTAATARARGLQVDLEGTGAGAGALLPRLLLERPSAVVRLVGDRALSGLDDGLAGSSVPVTRLVVYETALQVPSATEVARALDDTSAACFTSPSSLEALLAVTPDSWRRDVLPIMRAAALGRTTAEALEAAGVQDVRVAAEPNDASLAVAAVAD